MGVCAAALLLAAPGMAPAAGKPLGAPWMNPKLSPDARADLVLARLTLDEQIALLHGSMPLFMGPKRAGRRAGSAGYMPGVPELGIPDLTESDASLGVANAGRKDDDATALPSGLALAATWDARTAFAGGAMIGKEARQKGFNVLLAGGVNLLRDPRNGRNFEYLGEDPLLAGTLAGAVDRAASSRTTSSPPPSTTRSTTRRPGAWCWTPGSTRRRSARATCWPSRSPSRPASRAR